MERRLSRLGRLDAGRRPGPQRGRRNRRDGSFSGTLTNAIDSLEQTQVQGTNAAQGLATGQLSDPTQAITAVENASLAMDLASQIRTKLVDATQNIFQTQV